MTTRSDVVAVPRVQIGQVIVSRARWRVLAMNMPSRDAGERPAAYWLRLHGWLLEHRIPRRCFVRRHDPRQLPGDALGPVGGALDPAMKPKFVDFESWYSVRSWERNMGSPDSILTLEEALPDPATAFFSTGGPPQVAELLLETTDDDVVTDRA